MNAEIPLWVLGSTGSPPSKRLSILQIMFLVVVELWGWLCKEVLLGSTGDCSSLLFPGLQTGL